MTDDLRETQKLTVKLGAPDRNTLILNPQTGKQIELLKQPAELYLYVDREEFIAAGDDCREVLVDQQNDFEPGAIQLEDSLNNELGGPDRIKVFRKLDNLFLKPL